MLERDIRLPFYFGFALACILTTTAATALGYCRVVRAVATTLLADVACKLLVAPSGALALGLLAWRMAGRSVAAAAIAGEAGCMAAPWGACSGTKLS